jgi:hypothetical protein
MLLKVASCHLPARKATHTPLPVVCCQLLPPDPAATACLQQRLCQLCCHLPALYPTGMLLLLLLLMLPPLLQVTMLL